MLPDKIIINIPTLYNNYSSDYTLPHFQNDKIIINNNCKDYGPATKLLGLYNYDLYNSMSENDLIIIIDDDRIYNENLIKTMLFFHEKHRDKVLTVAGWEIKLLTRNKYENSNKKQPRGIEFHKDGYCDILGGCCGFLISKKNCPFINKEIFHLQKEDSNYYVDDIWLSGFITLNNTDIYLVPNSINSDERRHENDRINALADENRYEKNVKCIEFFRDNYNIWK